MEVFFSAPALRIAATGACLPKQCISNTQLIADYGVDSSDEWIISRTGIQQRHMCDDRENTSTLAIGAAQNILANAGLKGRDVDVVLVATTTPTRPFPSVAADVQAAIGAQGSAMDIQAVCSGFLYGLSVAKGLFASGQATRVLLIGAEHMTRQLDWHDRTTAVLFGDGAAGVLLEATTDENALFEVSVGADGSKANMLCTPTTGRGITMHGREVFKHAVREMANLHTHWLPKDQGIDWLIPHQANQRILDAAFEAAQQHEAAKNAQLVSTIGQHANTSAASIPLALHTAVSDGHIKRGDVLYMNAFGAGFTWGHGVVRF